MTKFGQNTCILPYDARVEYLECDGSSYINLGFQQDEKYRLETAVKIPFTQGLTYNMFGAHETTTTGGSYCVAANVTTGPTIRVMNTSGTATIASQSLADNNEISITIDSNINLLKVRNMACDLGDIHVRKVPFILFGSRPTIMCNAGVKIYHFMYESSTTYVDLTPVRVGNIGYMYDKVSKQLFENKGTGEFVLGPDK